MAVEARADAIVVGGGIAGLAAAAYLGRDGRRVVVLEKAAALGARAVTQDHDGFRFNLGAHALLRWGAAARVFRELDVPFRAAGRMHCVDAGVGEPVVLVHGTPTWSFEWRHVIAGLSPDYRCLARAGGRRSRRRASWRWRTRDTGRMRRHRRR